MIPFIPYDTLGIGDQELLEDILTTPRTAVFPIVHGKFTGDTYYVTRDGRGATFDSLGQFKHFGGNPITSDTFPIGDSLVRIQYELGDGEERPSTSDLVDEVGTAITLVWKNAAPTRISWGRTDGWELESLEIGGEPRDDLRFVDVSERWEFLIGGTLENVLLSHGASPLHLVWSVNLVFLGGKHLVVALGELDNGVPDYMPDSLVVTASERVARDYWPTNCDGPWTYGPAWGDEEGFHPVGYSE